MLVQPKDFKVQFGKYDVNVYAEYTLSIGFYLDEFASEELLYDELKMQSEFNLKLEDDVAFISLKRHKLNLNDAHSQRNLP